MAIPDANGLLHAVYQTSALSCGTALNIVDPDTVSVVDGQAEVSWIGALGLQLLTYDDTVTSNTTYDMAIPAGTTVLGSGIQVSGFGNAWLSADGPHPTDNTKWRFQGSVKLQSGGDGYSMDVTYWMVVANTS
ncbi:MAG TPA: hypothetical protein VGG75_38315 [Trebonia sp.]|jgi:hypothetical protein